MLVCQILLQCYILLINMLKRRALPKRIITLKQIILNILILQAMQLILFTELYNLLIPLLLNLSIFNHLI